MAVHQPRMDVDDVEELNLRDVSFQMKNPRIKPGYRVFIKGNFQADFHSGDSKAAQLSSAWAEQEMALKGDTYEVVIPDLEVGQTYEYVYKIVPNDGNPEFYIKDGAENKKKRIEGVDNRPKRAKEDAVRRDVKAEVARILTASKDAKSAEGMGHLVEGLEMIIRQRHGVKESVEKLFLEVVAEVIREDKTLPHEIKGKFEKGNLLSDFRDLNKRLEEGSRLFRQAVFLKLAGDESSRKFFKLDAKTRYNDSNPLGNAKFNEIFRRYCDSRCLTAASAYFEKHLKAVAEKEVVDPSLLAERMADADAILKRLPAAEQARVKEVLKEIPTSRKAQVADWLVNVWGLVSLTGIDGFLGFWVSILKSGAEGASGVSLKEVMSKVDKGDWKPIADAAWKNNVFAKWFKEKGGLWNRVKETVGRAIPVWGGIKHAGESVSGFSAKGMENLDSGTISAEELISSACDSAINPK